MAILSYGGIALSILKTHSILAEDVYDETGLDYLWTKYTFDVTGVVNQAATSFITQQGNPAPVAAPPAPGGAAGNVPFLTIQNIRDSLALPRQSLTYADENGNVMVQSPALAPVPAGKFQPGGGIQNNIVQPPQQLDCDCDGGPKPLRPVEVLQVHGQGKSVIVRFVVSTTVNDSIFWVAQGGLTVLGQAAPKPPVILSNRWSVILDTDESAFSTRVVTGRAVFRADLLRDIVVVPNNGQPNRLAVPDDFRAYMMGHPIPPGFQRRQVWVEEEPSGFAVRYRVTDVQLPVTLTDHRACKVEVVVILGMSSKGAEQAAIDNLSALYEDGIEAADLFGLDTALNPGRALGTSLRSLKRKIGLVAEALPQSTDRYVITVTGQPNSTRLSLVNVAYKVLFNYLNRADSFFSSTSAYLSYDGMGKWCRLECDVKRGPVSSTIVKVIGAGATGAVIDMRGRIPADDGIDGVSSSVPGVQPPYPNDAGTRGTALEAMICQVLMYPYTEAPSPPALSQAGQGLLPP